MISRFSAGPGCVSAGIVTAERDAGSNFLHHAPMHLEPFDWTKLDDFDEHPGQDAGFVAADDRDDGKTFYFQ